MLHKEMSRHIEYTIGSYAKRLFYINDYELIIEQTSYAVCTTEASARPR